MRTLLAPLALCAALGCSADLVAAPPPRTTIADDAVPPRIGGLTTTPEEVGDALDKAGAKAYVSAIRLWSLREGKRLRATLQVSRFTPDAPTGDPTFQLTVASQVGGTTPRRRRLGTDVVYVGAGNRQVYYLWFRGAVMLLLAVPQETTTSRSLLRAALREVTP